MVNRKIQERNLMALARNKGFQFTDTFFPYTSGEIGPYYVQSGAVMNNGQDFAVACKDMTNLVQDYMNNRHGFRTITGGESTDWIFSQVVAAQLSLPHTMIYKNGKVVGADIKGQYVGHVADLNNEGSSIRDRWVPTIKKLDGNIEHVFFYVDRLEDGMKVVNDLELVSNSIVPLDSHAWKYLQDKGVVSKEVYGSLMARMEDKNAWARKMLKSDKGMQELRRLYDDPLTKDKAEKIINVGYPDIKEEFILKKMR